MKKVTPAVHLKETHWAEMKGDHPERKNNKKKGMKVEGNKKLCSQFHLYRGGTWEGNRA